MTNKSTIESSYSQQSAQKTLIFVIALMSLAAVLSIIVLYMMHRQSEVLIQSEYQQSQAPAIGTQEK